MLEDWLPAFSGAPTIAPTLRDGWRVQHIIDAARRSSAGDGWVELDAPLASEGPAIGRNMAPATLRVGD
jgi:hypothetical protein